MRWNGANIIKRRRLNRTLRKHWKSKYCSALFYLCPYNMLSIYICFSNITLLFRGFFNLDPKVFKIAAGEKMELSITGLSYKVTTIKEMWYLVGSVEGINKKELLLQCEIVAEFVDPKIEVSSSVIDLQYDYGPYSEYYKLTGKVN